MEHINGKDSSSLLASVDYSRVLHSGVSQDVLESLLREHDSAKQAEIAGLRLEVQKLTTALQQVQSAGAVNAQESTSIQAEIARLRQEFATAIASVRGLLVEGDGDLHEMQLTSLRRQVTQLEGVLESNYQRELRVAEDRETALRSEMAQMRQDLRVALETLYRMPADGADGSNDETLLVLQKQVTDLGSAMERVLREQQQAGVERENALRNEIAQMRRDLLVTLEASYQLPEDRSGELDEQFTAWRGQVAELQHIILGTQDAQERHAQMQRETIVQELTRLQEQTKEALAAIPDAERGDLQQVRSMLHHISECLSAQPREDPERLERLEREFLARNEALGVELTRLGDEVRSALDTYAGRDTSTDGVAAAAIDALRQQISDMRDALRQSNDGEQERLAERGREIQTAFAALHEELRNGLASVEASSAGGSGSEEEWQSVRHQLSDLLIRIEQSKAEQQELVKSEAVALRDEISQAGQAWQTAVDTIRESSNDSTERSAEVLTHQLNGMLEQLRMDWSAAQTEQYRQVIAQVAQLQSDIDEVSTAIQGLEPVLPVADQESERQLAVRLDALMAALETQSDRQGSMPSGGLDALQAEVAALRTEIGTALERATSQVAGAESGPGLALDDITRAIAMQLQAVSAESERLAANRDGVLRLELAQVRQEMQTAVQQQRSASSAPSLEGVAVDLTPIQAEIAALRERLEAAPGSPDSSLRDDISQLRTDLQATIDSLASTLQSNADQSDEQSTFLRSKVAELGAQLESARTTQEQLVDRRDEIAQVREDIRATIDAFLSEQNHAFEGTDSETKT
ncbi:MAG TPA: hypothetical protein VF221_17975, partial [Chloroflexota bacterium]